MGSAAEKHYSYGRSGDLFLSKLRRIELTYHLDDNEEDEEVDEPLEDEDEDEDDSDDEEDEEEEKFS